MRIHAYAVRETQKSFLVKSYLKLSKELGLKVRVEKGYNFTTLPNKVALGYTPPFAQWLKTTQKVSFQSLKVLTKRTSIFFSLKFK